MSTIPINATAGQAGTVSAGTITADLKILSQQSQSGNLSGAQSEFAQMLQALQSLSGVNMATSLPGPTHGSTNGSGSAASNPLVGASGSTGASGGASSNPLQAEFQTLHADLRTHHWSGAAQARAQIAQDFQSQSPSLGSGASSGMGQWSSVWGQAGSTLAQAYGSAASSSGGINISLTI